MAIFIIVAIYTKINWSKHVCVLGLVQSYACPDDWLAECSQEPTGAQAARHRGPPKIWQIFPISGSLSRTLSTPWERRPMTCTLHSYKTKTQDKDTGTFWFWPFCSNHVGGTRIMIYITCYSSKRKGLNRKMGIWYRIQIPIYFAKKMMFIHCILYTFKHQSNRLGKTKKGKF